MVTRADRIFEILQGHGPRLRVAEVHMRLAEKEGAEAGELRNGIVSATLRQENKTRRQSGKAVRFNLYGDGNEKWGYVSLISREEKKPAGRKQILQEYTIELPELVEEANESVREDLQKAISKMTWQEFESNFLADVLDALGFTKIQITQRSRDGGRDALCTYQRGLVESEALVSAKHWKSGRPVGPEEVQRLRGLKGDADTGIIVTSSRFTDGAIEEAKPGQNIRAIALIDGDLIVETCMKYQIGVKEIDLPTLYHFFGFNEQEEEGV